MITYHCHVHCWSGGGGGGLSVVNVVLVGGVFGFRVTWLGECWCSCEPPAVDIC